MNFNIRSRFFVTQKNVIIRYIHNVQITITGNDRLVVKNWLLQ